MVALATTALTSLGSVPSAMAEFGVVPGSVEMKAVERDGTVDFRAGCHPFEYTVRLLVRRRSAAKPLEGGLTPLSGDRPPEFGW